MTEPRINNPLTIQQKFDLMTLIRDEYAKADLTDTEFARHASAALGRPVQAGTITHYREGLSVDRYTAPTPAELRAKLRELQAELDKRGESAA